MLKPEDLQPDLHDDYDPDAYNLSDIMNGQYDEPWEFEEAKETER